MKEYRIVCNRKCVHSDGKVYNYSNSAVWVTGSSLPRYTVYNYKADAIKALSDTIRKAKAFDAKTQKLLASGDPLAVGYWQSDIRIQSRNVTKWDDCK